MESSKLISCSCFFIFIPFIFFLLYSYLIPLQNYVFTPIFNYLKNPRFWCNCEVCQAYITRSWTVNFTNISDWYTYLLKNSSSNTIHIHILGNIVTANPENVEYILKQNFDNYPKGKQFSTILGDFLGRGIFNVDGELWRFQKKIVSLEIGRVSIKTYVVEVVQQEIKHRLIPILSSVSDDTKHAVVDLQDMFRRFSFNCIYKFSFGLDPKCLEGLESDIPLSEFEVSFDLASKLSAERAMSASPLTWKIKRLFNVGSEKKLKQAIKNINVLASEVISQRRKLGFSKKSDLLSRFMDVCEDESYLRDIIISFLLAGRDTVASALTGFFLLLAQHPDVERAILQESDLVIRENHNYEQLRELHYLHAAVFESLRLYPPVQFDSKFCLQDDTLVDGTMVKKGTRVTYHPYAMGRMENLWGSDCMEFKPERWLKEGVFYPENPFKYPVFQAGVRNCLGKEMALLEIKSVAVWILRRFHIDLAQPQKNPLFTPGLTATFSGGLPVFVRKRRALTRGRGDVPN